jgi:regulator of protease activity HflC (stomatin/prohibitin superfamily)
MRGGFGDRGGPDIKVVVAEYRDAMRKRLRWVGPAVGGAVLLLLLLSGLYSVDPGEVGVVRTFGKESGQSQPGLHFALPLLQQVDIVDLATVRRAEIGFRSGPEGQKRVDSEALMLTGDENIIEALMIVQYQVHDPSKFLFKLKDPEATLQAAAEVALRSVVGTVRITSSIEELLPAVEAAGALTPPLGPPPEEEAQGGAAPAPSASASAAPPEPPPAPSASASAPGPDRSPRALPSDVDPAQDILTTGREQAQVKTKELLQELMDLYESGIHITEVKLQDVDAPDNVKDAFHDVVRAREERQQLVNKALGYRQDRLPRARGEAQKILRSAEAYKRERVLRAEGESARFRSILGEYKKARGVTRERIHLETLERILASIDKKVFVDDVVAKNALPLLQIGDGSTRVAPQGGP